MNALTTLAMAMDLGFALGRGEKVDVAELADKHLTIECPRCQAHPQDCPNSVEFGGTCDNGKIGGDAGERPWEEEDCPVCDGEGHCPDCKGTGRVPKDGADD